MSDDTDTSDDLTTCHIEQGYSLEESYFVSKIKPMIGVILIFSFIIGLAVFVGYDIHSSGEVRKEQRVAFIKKMRSEGWGYSCVGGGKMVFSKPDSTHPFTVQESCRGLK